MIVCDVCKEKVGETHIQISVRGEQRHKLYDFGLDTTYFDVCSVKCAIELLNEMKPLIAKVIK